MAAFLYHLGRFCSRHYWLVAAVWLVLLACLAVAAWAFRVPTNDSFTIPGTESQQTVDMLQERFPDRSGGNAIAVFHAPDGEDITTGDRPDAVQDTVADIRDIDGVSSVTDPFELYEQGYQQALSSDELRQSMIEQGVAQAQRDNPGLDEETARSQVEPRVDQQLEQGELPEEVRDEVRADVLEEIDLFSGDRTTAMAQVQFAEPDAEVAPRTVDDLLDSGDPAEDAGLRVEYSGQAITVTDVAGIHGGESVGLAVALVILVLNFGGLVAAAIPIVNALAGTGAGIALVYALSHVLDLTSTAPLLAVMLGIAVGIDYSLFVLSRHRQQLVEGIPPGESTRRAIGTAGSAVVFAGVTVVIALLGLSIVRIPFLTVMGVAAAITVAGSVLVAITLLPALLGLLGHHVRSLRVPGLGRRAERALTSENTLGARWARTVTRHPVVPIAAVLVIVVLCFLPVRDMRLGLPTDESSSPDSTQHQAYDIITEEYGEGYNAFLLVTVSNTGGGDVTGAAEDVADRLGDLDRVTTVQTPVYNDGADTAIVTVIPDDGPSAESTQELLHDVRDLRPDLQDSTGARIAVTGATATSIDTSQRIAEAMPLFLAVVVGLAFLLLMAVFRSLLVPLKAALGFVFSMGAALGATVAVFQWGHGSSLLGVTSTETLLSFLPILLIGTLFGLAMDYEVFLVSRMREDYVHGSEPRRAVVDGFRSGARVVVSAAVIMAAVFASFVFSDNTTIQPVAFALAVGVLIDAFLIRMTLVPAVMALFGRASWWLPRWLDRALPNIDIEGESLRGGGGDERSDAPTGRG
ncbi:RND superfamily putative drug exporter [Haloactinospora alba]|uniref:RND superfamily putative drug exporter n=1 Tax=Haloactinospora alba TaxID=405555 RepID=A0A543NN46_9ACTN|nr:MMPL family transporter [Haloactinospora alba]TQN33246.1 RND superfamily putative drug exporter [Haloactinospora alba]